MKKKVVMYRVELYNDNAPIDGMRSDFAKHYSLENARRWAIERGKKGNAGYVRLFKKNLSRYNHFDYVELINL